MINKTKLLVTITKKLFKYKKITKDYLNKFKFYK